MVLSIIFLEDKHKMLLHLSIFYEYQQFFQHCICFSIQPPDYSDPWPTLARSTSFFLIMLFKYSSNVYFANPLLSINLLMKLFKKYFRQHSPICTVDRFEYGIQNLDKSFKQSYLSCHSLVYHNIEVKHLLQKGPQYHRPSKINLATCHYVIFDALSS
jgi:hypothetical protein